MNPRVQSSKNLFWRNLKKEKKIMNFTCPLYAVHTSSSWESLGASWSALNMIRPAKYFSAAKQNLVHLIISDHSG